MAKQKTMWVAEDGSQHDREMDAIRADMRYKAHQVLKNIYTGGGIDLKRIEGFNEETLQPVIDYFESIKLEAVARRKMHG